MRRGKSNEEVFSVINLWHLFEKICKRSDKTERARCAGIRSQVRSASVATPLLGNLDVPLDKLRTADVALVDQSQRLGRSPIRASTGRHDGRPNRGLRSGQILKGLAHFGAHQNSEPAIFKSAGSTADSTSSTFPPPPQSTSACRQSSTYTRTFPPASISLSLSPLITTGAGGETKPALAE